MDKIYGIYFYTKSGEEEAREFYNNEEERDERIKIARGYKKEPFEFHLSTGIHRLNHYRMNDIRDIQNLKDELKEAKELVKEIKNSIVALLKKQYRN